MFTDGKLIKEPKILPQVVDTVQIASNESLLSPGYIFTAPQTFLQGWGPKIYTLDGELIWDGNYTTDQIATEFHVCDYAGSRGSHLCWHESSMLGAFKKGQNESEIHDYNRIFDASYTQVAQNLSDTGSLEATTDAHEFDTIHGGQSYVQTIYIRKTVDLREWGGLEDGVVLDGCFEEMDVATETEVFSWCYLDHLPLETFVYIKTDAQKNFSTTIGGAGHWLDPWDFFHPNSIDKNEEGDYLVSGRHLDQVIKIAGPESHNGEPGTVLWRLGGHSSDFDTSPGATFSRQHDARFLSTSSEETFISLFDNSWEGESAQPLRNYSSARIIRVNNSTQEATLWREYAHPYGQLCRSGGNAQLLPNGNIFVGWGFIREVTEFHKNGTVLFHGVLKNLDGPQVYNYRTYKYPWSATPAHPPKALAYSQSCHGSPLVAYVSWNGATHVHSWRFFVSHFPQGPWQQAGTFVKDDFETHVVLGDTRYDHVVVEALQADGSVISKTTATTFVPAEALDCGKNGCAEEFEYPPSFSKSCPKRYSTPWSVLLSLMIAFETYSWVFHKYMFHHCIGERREGYKVKA